MQPDAGDLGLSITQRFGQDISRTGWCNSVREVSGNRLSREVLKPASQLCDIDSLKPFGRLRVLPTAYHDRYGSIRLIDFRESMNLHLALSGVLRLVLRKNKLSKNRILFEPVGHFSDEGQGVDKIHRRRAPQYSLAQVGIELLLVHRGQPYFPFRSESSDSTYVADATPWGTLAGIRRGNPSSTGKSSFANAWKRILSYHGPST